jgi:hypothetical protein
MLAGVEAGLTQAMDKLPDNVAKQVKGKLLDRCVRVGGHVCPGHARQQQLCARTSGHQRSWVRCNM